MRSIESAKMFIMVQAHPNRLSASQLPYHPAQAASAGCLFDFMDLFGQQSLQCTRFSNRDPPFSSSSTILESLLPYESCLHPSIDRDSCNSS
ncbi:hypothetical protein MRB53_037186 [Persea americana]|nr:hypothetical protein MRB53_037186 [Persea americana]